MTEICGMDLASLRQRYVDPQNPRPWHYAIFGHAIRYCGLPFFNSGQAELPGFNFVVGMGQAFHEPPRRSYFCADDFSERCVRAEAGTFMHELGHNLDLHHGGDQDDNDKPNYLSIVNYLFQVTGVPFSLSPGSTDVAGHRVDYSDFALAALDENRLDEAIGLGGPPDATGVSYYLCPFDADISPAHCNVSLGRLVPATGPIDWNGNGVIEDQVRLDVNYLEVATQPDPFADRSSKFSVLTGFDD